MQDSPQSGNPVSTSIEELLHQYWGYTAFRPLQREAIDAVLAQRDSLVVLPTGGGKSLCFQLPALAGVAPSTQYSAPGTALSTQHSALSTSVALVISPLIALMKDQVDGLVAQGVAAACLHSGQSSEQRRVALDLLRAGTCRLLYVAPERAIGETADGFRALMGARGVAYVAIDEAHCISQWGHDFRPEYRQLAGLREAFAGTSLHAYTATATPRVQRDICDQLRLVQPVVHIGSFDRANLTYRVLPRVQFKQQLQTILLRHDGEAGIIYCLSRREVDELAAALSSDGIRALPYHAGLDDATRHRNQDAFLNEEVDVMVATVAFGMGIDRSDVRFVVHAGAPQSLEQYQQEAGRAGRDGLPAECALVTSPADFARWRSLLESDGQWTDSARTLLRDMERYAAATSCRHRALVGYFGQDLAPGSCGACDWCLAELEPADEPKVLAQKVLSAVARTGQRWGVGHVVAVLRGESTETVTARGHHALSVFGLLREVPAPELRGYVDQLTQGGFLTRTGNQYPTLQISPAGADLLRGQAECVLFRQPRPVKGRQRRQGPRTDASWKGVDQRLFEKLRALRLELARGRGVPPYVIFHDQTLRELAKVKPRHLNELHDITGIGERKAAAFGPAILDLITTHDA
jgi:ATP-dependent DNA helicase RecQ